MTKEKNNIFYIRKTTKELKSFDKLQEFADYVEEQAKDEFNKSFNKQIEKVIRFKMTKENLKERTRTYSVSLDANKRVLGFARIPLAMVYSPSLDFTITIQKSKYGYVEKEE